MPRYNNPQYQVGLDILPGSGTGNSEHKDNKESKDRKTQLLVGGDLRARSTYTPRTMPQPTIQISCGE